MPSEERIESVFFFFAFCVSKTYKLHLMCFVRLKNTTLPGKGHASFPCSQKGMLRSMLTKTLCDTEVFCFAFFCWSVVRIKREEGLDREGHVFARFERARKARRDAVVLWGYLGPLIWA